MNGLPQNVLLNFRLEFPKSDLTIYLPSGISEILFQMVNTSGETGIFFFCNIFVITFYVYKAALPARRDLDSSKQELGKLFLHERMHDDDLSQPVIFTYNIFL